MVSGRCLLYPVYRLITPGDKPQNCCVVQRNHDDVCDHYYHTVICIDGISEGTEDNAFSCSSTENQWRRGPIAYAHHLVAVHECCVQVQILELSDKPWVAPQTGSSHRCPSLPGGLGFAANELCGIHNIQSLTDQKLFSEIDTLIF